MKIGISAEWIGTRAGGPEVYTANLIRYLRKLDNTNEYHIYLSESHAMEHYKNMGDRIKPRLMWGRSRWIVLPVCQPLAMLSKPVDLFHATFVAPPICPAPFILTITELGFERFPEYYPRRMNFRLSNLSRWGAKRARHIIAISEYTKNDLVEIYGIDPGKISVAYCGVSSRFKPEENTDRIQGALNQYGITGKYILYVGKIEARKNLARLISAYHELIKNTNYDHDLVIVGDRSYLYDDVDQKINELKLSHKVRILEKVPRDELNTFYNGADIFVFTSLLEAFGIPPVEAMACGTPVLASDATAIPEVVGDAALLVNAQDINSIAEGMNQLLSDKGLRERLVQQGFQRSAKFTWEQGVRTTMNIYEKVYEDLHRK